VFLKKLLHSIDVNYGLKEWKLELAAAKIAQATIGFLFT
jgi:hypothetical protein